jgi:hypothetical protein
MTIKNLVVVGLLAAGCAADPTGGGGGGGAGGGSGSGSDPDDPGQHPPGALYGHVLDERGDTIDFASGEPVHTHAGPSVDLSTGCPTLYTYAYLTGAQTPTYGKEATPNPLAWHVKPAPATLDDSATAYRVRSDDGRVLLDWTAMKPGDDGVYTITLHRDGASGFAALGTDIGTMYVDARFRPAGGADKITSACWVNHPLAAPIATSPPVKGELFGMSLPASSPLAPLVATIAGHESGIAIATMPLVQQTAEPIALSIALPKPSGHGSQKTANAYVDLGVTTAMVGCTDEGLDACATLPSTATAYLTSQGVLDGTWTLRVVDDATGTSTCAATFDQLPLHCTLPARGPATAPHGYHLVLGLTKAGTITPIHDPASPIADYTAGAVSYTGVASQPRTNCDQPRSRTINGQTAYWCAATHHYAYITALDQAQLALDAINFDMTSSVGTQGTADPLAYLTIGSLTLPATTWDAGNKGL